MQEFFSFFLSKVKIGIFLLFGSYQKINSQKNQKNERKIRFFVFFVFLDFYHNNYLQFLII